MVLVVSRRLGDTFWLSLLMVFFDPDLSKHRRPPYGLHAGTNDERPIVQVAQLGIVCELIYHSFWRCFIMIINGHAVSTIPDLGTRVEVAQSISLRWF